MNRLKKVIVTGILLAISLLLHIYSADEMRIETGYSTSFFPSFSKILRHIFGWIPFSVGDFIYGFLPGWLCWKLYRFLRFITKPGKSVSVKNLLLNASLDVILFCASLYLIFNIFWGMNYDRKGIAFQLGLKMEKYDQPDLEDINELLVKKVNLSKRVLIDSKVSYPANRDLYLKVSQAYKNASGSFSFLKYEPASIKTSMWGWLGNYTGFTGYYNPFTGEAQLNTTVLKFLQPFVACHETAHQLGYAKEMEANFVGYLAASASRDTLFHYSVYLDLFTYANRNLFIIDSAAAMVYRKQLDPAVIEDLKEWIRFNNAHRSFIEPAIRWIYGKYLQGNRQPQGILSYDEVTAFIISYYKKYQKI